MLAVLAVGSLLVGNLAAIAQTNLKRMLAFSTISQMGFVLLGLMSGVINGNTISSAERLQLVDVLHHHLCADHAGHLRRHPAAVARGFRERRDLRFGRPEPAQPAVRRRDGVCLFSLAGIPPMVGFYAKLSVLQALMASGRRCTSAWPCVRRDDVAGGRVLLPACGQGHVL
jgi:NADH-quinone oxidoreductase subunit N